MLYVIPRGTPVEIAQYGHYFCAHTTHRELAFPELLSATEDELTFHDGYWQIIVSRALVLEESDDGGTEPT